MRLAEVAKTQGIPVVYYFSPSAWAWRKGRAKTVAGRPRKFVLSCPLKRKCTGRPAPAWSTWAIPSSMSPSPPFPRTRREKPLAVRGSIR